MNNYYLLKIIDEAKTDIKRVYNRIEKNKEYNDPHKRCEAYSEIIGNNIGNFNVLEREIQKEIDKDPRDPKDISAWERNGYPSIDEYYNEHTSVDDAIDYENEGEENE